MLLCLVVVVIGELIQHVNPVVSPLTVKVFPHHSFQGSVKPFYHGNFFVRLCGEVVYAMTFQKIPNTNVIKLLTLVKLSYIWVLTEPRLKLIQQ